MSHSIHEETKIFRAEKTTKNRDDFRVLIAGSLLTIIMLLTFPMIGSIYDHKFAERPFVKATIELVDTQMYGKPMILYDADPTQDVNATWIATIFDANGTRISTRRGQGSYEYSEDDNPRLWTWDAFFESATSNVPPNVPVVPFRICVRYVAQTRDTGVVDSSEQMCSSLYDNNDSDKTIKESTKQNE